MDETTSQPAHLHFLDYWRVIRSRKEIVIAAILIVLVTGVFITAMMPQIFMSEAQIAVREDDLDVQVFDRKMGGTFYNPFFLRTQYEMIQAKPILYPVIEELGLRDKWAAKYGKKGQPLIREEAYLVLMKHMKVEQARDTSLIAIQVFEEDTQLAADIANRVAQSYLEYRQSTKHSEIKRAIDTLENELTKQKAKVDEAETNMERVRRESGVAMLSTGIRANKVGLQKMEADRSDARVDMLVRKARIDQVEKLKDQELLNAITFIVQDPAILAIRNQLVETEVNLRNLEEQYGENHPEIKRLRAAGKELRSKLNDAVQGLKRGLEADYQVAKQKYDAIDEELSKARTVDIEAEGSKFLPYSKAEREVEVRRTIMEALQARVTQQGIELQVPRTTVEVINPAEPSAKPVSPKLFLNLIISLLLGVVAGVGMAYFIEYLDTSMKTVEDVEGYLKLPVIGIIPQKVKLLIETGPESKHAESYRVLRANLIFANRERQGKVFCLTSGGVGEGKSTTLFNLAYVCASLGDKVLVIDSDMRRPVQHKLFKLSNKEGLTNVLLENEPVEKFIQPTPVEKLFFLPSGRLPRSSVGLLDIGKIKALLAHLKEQYDFIFMDSPPLMGISDSSIIASAADGLLLVVQYRKYPRSFSLRARKIGQNIGAHFYGVVMNNINVVRDDYYYYYHSQDSYYQKGSGSAAEDGEETAGRRTKGKSDAL